MPRRGSTLGRSKKIRKERTRLRHALRKPRRQRNDLETPILVKEFIIVLDDGEKKYRWNRYEMKWCDGDGGEASMDGLIELLWASPKLVQICGKPAWAYEVVFGWIEDSANFEGHAADDSDVYKYSASSMEKYMRLHMGCRRPGAAVVQ
jgi:hypothetical protein